jgi:hypothetical protein
MAPSAIDSLQSILGEEAACTSKAKAQILVLEPIGPRPGLTAILLDQPKQLIGWDVECSIQVPDAGVHSRHAVILRGQKRVVIKAWDPRTWLNGLPVTESRLAEGDLLRVGPIEFRVRAATTDELLREIPEGRCIPGSSDRCDTGGNPALRRSRLSAIRARIKERRVELARDFERMHAERALLEAERAELQVERAKLETGRAALESGQAKFQAERNAVATTQLATVDAAVADYMERLLGRMRSRKDGSVVDEEPFANHSSQTPIGSENHVSPLTGTGVDLESPEGVRSRAPRRSHNVEEIRADFGTLRKIANLSARAAVASHSSRKLRESSTAVTLPLAITSFVLAGALFLIGGSEARFYSQALGIVMLGFIALIEMANSSWKLKNLDTARTPAVNEDSPEEPTSAETGGESGASTASAK